MIHEKRKAIVLWLVGVAITIGLASLIWFIPQYQAQKARERATAEINNLNPNDQPKERLQLEKDLITTENNARTIIAQILGGLILLTGLYFTYRNLRVTEEGKFTDRFSNAIELLGNDKLDIRLGGIYALERLARDSKNDHWTIMEVLTTYVRDHSKKKAAGTEPRINGEKEEDSKDRSPTPSADIQAILDVIGRRKWAILESHRLNLENANLRVADLKEADLRKANLCFANLDGADLRKANLNGADLSGAILSWAILKKANLSGANLFKANLEGADLSGADLKGAEYLTWEQVSQAIIDDDTKLPPDLEAKWKVSKEQPDSQDA